MKGDRSLTTNSQLSTNNSQLPKGYKQTEVGLIPKNWETAQLIKNAKVIDSLHKTPEFCADGYSMVRVADIKTGNLRLHETLKVCDAVFEEFIQNYQPKKGDIVLSRVGSYGVSSFVETDEPFCLGQNTVVIESKIPPRFLYYILNSEYIREQIEDKSYGSGYKSLSLRNIKELIVAFPPTIAEQNLIARALSDTDALIESLEQLLAKKRQIKQGAMQELLRPKKSWMNWKLSDVAEIRSGGTPSTTRSEFWNGDILWCTPTDITALKGQKYLRNTTKLITVEGLNSSSAELIPANSIVMTSRATIGECAINKVPVSTNQGFKNFVPLDEIDVEFLYYLLQTQKQRFISLCAGSTFLEIGKNQLTEFVVSIPNIEEQKAIATILSDMDLEIGAIETKLTKARQLKQGMMHELLTGKIRLIDKGNT